MRKKLMIYAALVTIAIVAGYFLFSTENYDYKFENPKEAIKACRKDLSSLIGKKKMSTSALSKEVCKWIAIRDSTISCFMRADSNEINSDIFTDFYNVSDSIGIEITRLARSKDRTAEDLLYVQIHTANKKNEIKASENYKNAKAFFDNIKAPDKNMTLDEAVKTYHKILNNTKNITKEQSLLKFMEIEDQCFQVIMKNLTNAQSSDLEQLSQKAEMFFSRLMFSLRTNQENKDNSRILAYLHMRINKRVIMNTKTVCDIIDNHVKINEEQKMTFRWMLLQPFMSLDNNSWTYITDEQCEILEELAPKLHKYMLKLDSPAEVKDKEKLKELKNTIGKYLLVAYLKQIL